MSDLIDRKALMKEFADFVRRSNNSDFAPVPNWNDAVSLVGSMPTIEQWIPCSERLPEEGHLVLTTIRGTDFILLREKETLEDAIERTQKMLRVSCGFWGEDGWYGSDGYPEIVKPIAWMPLPEPWKGEQDE